MLRRSPRTTKTSVGRSQNRFQISDELIQIAEKPGTSEHAPEKIEQIGRGLRPGSTLAEEGEFPDFQT